MLHLDLAQTREIHIASLCEFIANNLAKRFENLFGGGASHNDLFFF